MLLSELKKNVIASGGSLKIRSIDVTIADGDVDFKSGYDLIAFINHTEDEDKEVSDILSLVNPLKNFSKIIMIAQYIGVNTDGYEPIIKEVEVIKEVERETSETHKLRGMVDAYEKIIIGRELNVGR